MKTERQLFYLYKDAQVVIKLEDFDYKFIGFNPKVNILNLTLLEKRYRSTIIIITTIFIMLLVGVVLFRRYQKKQKTNIRKEKIYKINQMFNNIKSRSQLENLYRERKTWEAYAEDKCKQNFYSVLDRHQYKEQWGPEELEEVRQAVQKIEIIFYD